MALLDDVKLALRSNNTQEVTDLINAALMDLSLSGVLVGSITPLSTDTDSLLKRAITVYCKANYGYDEKTEKFKESYELLKSHLSISRDYAYYKVTFTVTDINGIILQATITFGDEVKLTNQSGIAIFYLKQTDNIKYSIYKSGYTTQEVTIDVSENQNINVVLA